MAKVDKTKLTKQQWHAIRAQRRLEKEKSNSVLNASPVVEQPVFPVDKKNKNYIVCLKHGTKYDATYPNTLYEMVRRNCTIDYEFVCFTEDKKGLNNNIKVLPLPRIPKATGWWYKPMFFDPDFPLDGTILYIDLDVIIFRNIDNLFTYAPGRFCILRDFNRSIRPNWEKFNSSVFRLESKSLPYVYNDFLKDPAYAMRRFHGDQDWIYDRVRKDYEYWPDEWIQSYKWEMRGRPAMARDKNGKRNFGSPGTPKILPKTSIAVFHGEPNPHDCIDPWCKENWR